MVRMAFCLETRLLKIVDSLCLGPTIRSDRHAPRPRSGRTARRPPHMADSDSSASDLEAGTRPLRTPPAAQPPAAPAPAAPAPARTTNVYALHFVAAPSNPASIHLCRPAP